MRLCGVLILTAGLLAADPKAATDHDKIQGVWKITAEISNGKEEPPASNETMCLRFTADKMVVTDDKEKHEAAYKLEPSKKPPAIEVIPDDGPKKDKKARGIYQLDGDRLRICLTIEPGKEAPDDFTAEAGSGRVLLKLERVKP